MEDSVIGIHNKDLGISLKGVDGAEHSFELSKRGGLRDDARVEGNLSGGEVDDQKGAIDG